MNRTSFDAKNTKKFEKSEKVTGRISVLGKIFGGTLVTVLVFILSAFFIDPDRAGILGWTLVLGTFFLAMFGFSVLVVLLVHRCLFDEERILAQFGIVFRESLLLALFAIAMLILFRNGWLFWWDGILVGGLFLLIETTFLFRNRTRLNEK